MFDIYKKKENPNKKKYIKKSLAALLIGLAPFLYKSTGNIINNNYYEVNKNSKFNSSYDQKIDNQKLDNNNFKKKNNYSNSKDKKLYLLNLQVDTVLRLYNKNKFNKKKYFKKIKEFKKDFNYMYKYSEKLNVPLEVLLYIYTNENSLRSERSKTARYGPFQLSYKAVKDARYYLKSNYRELYKKEGAWLERKYGKSVWKLKWKLSKNEEAVEYHILLATAYLKRLYETIDDKKFKDEKSKWKYVIILYHAGLGNANKIFKKRNEINMNDKDYLHELSILLKKKEPWVSVKYIKNLKNLNID